MSPAPRAAAIWTALIPVALLLGCGDAGSPPEFLAPAGGANSTNSTNSTSAGACTAEDKKKMDEVGYGNGLTSLGGKIYLCAVGNVNLLLQIKEDPMKGCIEKDIGLSDGCAACFTYSSVQGAKNCRSVCLNGWCSKTCQECNEKVVPPSWMEQCTGYAIPKTPPCA